jgi:protein-S-isoprenylcysteine O-methyltransferase Ste14
VTERRKFWMRWRVRAGYPVAVIYWLLARPTPRSILIGAAIAAMGLLVRGAASGHLRKDQQLAVTGPYAQTRNPLYLGSAFLAVGFGVAGYSWSAGALVIGYFAIFYYAVMRNEEEDLRKRFGAAFDEYAARVPLFFPRFTKSGSPATSPDSAAFSWAQYRKNREYNALVGALAGLGLMVLRIWIRSRLGY